MKAVAFLALLIVAFQALADECLEYSSPVELRGTLRAETFPGPPNYESVAAGDKAETYFFVVPAAPICVRQGDSSGLEPATAGVARVQLVFVDRSTFGKLRPSLGKGVHCTGKLMGAHTGHHHSAVLLINSECNAARPITSPP